jgi:hypothetical protein
MWRIELSNLDGRVFSHVGILNNSTADALSEMVTQAQPKAKECLPSVGGGEKEETSIHANSTS